MERYFFTRAHAVLIGSDVSKLQICYQQIQEFRCKLFLRNMLRQIKSFVKIMIHYEIFFDSNIWAWIIIVIL